MKDNGTIGDAWSPDRAEGRIFRTIATNDIDDQAALLQGWNQSYNQLSAGSFSGVLSEAQLCGVYLFREVTSSSLYQIGALPDDLYAVGIPYRLEGAARFCGRVCDGSQLHVFSGHDGFEFHSPRGLDIGGIVVSRDALLRNLPEDEREAVEPTLMGPHLRYILPESAVRLRRLLAAAFEALSGSMEIDNSPVLRGALCRDVQSVLSEALVHKFASGAYVMPVARRSQLVRKARELAIGAPDGNITVEGMCKELGVSRRTLQNCFQEALGIRPATYLRAVRLNGARRAIKNCGSVTEAATTWGFWHFGRFARDYRALFGELPSMTARRFHGEGRTGEPLAF